MAEMTARIVIDGRLLANREGDDFHELTAFILLNLEEQFPDAHGEIVNNADNRVIQQYRKRPIC